MGLDVELPQESDTTKVSTHIRRSGIGHRCYAHLVLLIMLVAILLIVTLVQHVLAMHGFMDVLIGRVRDGFLLRGRCDVGFGLLEAL